MPPRGASASDGAPPAPLRARSRYSALSKRVRRADPTRTSVDLWHGASCLMRLLFYPAGAALRAARPRTTVHGRSTFHGSYELRQHTSREDPAQQRHHQLSLLAASRLHLQGGAVVHHHRPVPRRAARPSFQSRRLAHRVAHRADHPAHRFHVQERSRRASCRRRGGDPRALRPLPLRVRQTEDRLPDRRHRSHTRSQHAAVPGRHQGSGQGRQGRNLSSSTGA